VSSPHAFAIAELSREFGVTPHAIRFCGDVGLLSAAGEKRRTQETPP
jgi:DNA-binding transcriptional MerR regulator